MIMYKIVKGLIHNSDNAFDNGTPSSTFHALPDFLHPYTRLESSKVLDNLLPLVNRHNAQDIADTLPGSVVASVRDGSTADKVAHLSGDRLSLESFDLVVDHVAVLFIPDGNLAVSSVELLNAAPGLEKLQVARALLSRASSESLAGGTARGSSGDDATEDILLVESSAHTPVEEAAGVLPLKDLTNDTLGLHATSAIVEISELQADLSINGQKLLLALSHLLLDRIRLLLGEAGIDALPLEFGIDGVETGHGLELLVLAVLDTNNTLRLENTTTSIDISVHLHGDGVDGRIDDDPRATTKLAEGRNVDEDGLLELDEGVNDEGAILEDLVVHVALTTREATPVGKDHERKLLAVVEVVDGLGSLEGGVGVPDTASLIGHLLDRVGVGGIGRSDVLNGTGLDSDDTHGDTAEASATDDNGAGPSTEGLDEGVLVEETGLEASLVLLTSNHPPDVIRLLLGRGVDNVTVPGINAEADRYRVVALVRNERHPLDNLGDTSEVIVGSQVRDTIAIHDLSATKLQVGGVDLATQEVVERRSTSEDDGLALNLDSTLTKTDKVSANTNGTAGDERASEDVVVGSAGGTGNETRAAQALNTKTILSTNDGDNPVALLIALSDLLGDDAVLEALLGRIIKVEVLEASLRLAGILPGNAEVRHELGRETQASTRVGGQVDARNAHLAGKLSALEEEVVFLGSERADVEGDVVGDDDELTTVRVLRGPGTNEPADHAAGVGTRLAGDLSQVVVVIEHKFAKFDAFANRGLVGGKSRVLLDGLGPAVLDGLTEELREVIDVLSAHEMGLVTLRLEPVLGRVRGVDRQQVHGADLGSAADGVEHPLALLGLALGVKLDLDDVSGSVGDDNTQRVRHASDGVGADDANLDLGNTEAPAARTEAVEEALEGVLDLLGLKLEDRSEVQEHVVEIGVVVADDLKGIENVIDDTIGLRDEVLRSRDLIPQTARTDDSASEVTLVSLDTLADSLVHMNVLVLSEDGLDLELGQTSELELEGKSGLTVTNAIILNVLRATESEVARV